MSTPTTRQAAKDTNSTVYNTGKPCRNGHYADRNTSSGVCLKCATANNKNSVTKRKVKAKPPMRDWLNQYEESDTQGFYNPWVMMREIPEFWTDLTHEQRTFVVKQIELTCPEYFGS